MEENETLELKKSTSELKEAIISIAAILNKHKEGKLIFGVKNNGKVIGQDVTEKTLRNVSKAISDHIEPKVYPKIEKQKINNNDCVVVEFNGGNIPYYAYGRAYKRVADEDKLMSAKELEKLILEKNEDKLRWDSGICREAKLIDISSKKLKIFLNKSDKKFDGIESSLKKLNLIKNKKILNAGVILFGKNPEKFFPNAKLRCAVFATEDTSVTIDMQDFYGDLFYLIEHAENYILKNIHVGMKLNGLYRVDVPEISKEAFREAIINAFCHRDYWKYSSVDIAIFKNRVEIRSPGLLYGGLTIERIKKENVSERRNELIAQMFHEVHFVEKWGKGISLILSKEPETEFKEIGTHFITVFKRKWSEKWSEKVTKRQIEILNLISKNPKISKKELGVKLGEKLGVKLGENEAEILRILAENKNTTSKQLSVTIGISTTAIENNIAKLKKKGILKRIGSDKGGHWKVIDKF